MPFDENFEGRYRVGTWSSASPGEIYLGSNRPNYWQSALFSTDSSDQIKTFLEKDEDFGALRNRWGLNSKPPRLAPARSPHVIWKTAVENFFRNVAASPMA